jgi:hypothetical protein
LRDVCELEKKKVEKTLETQSNGNHFVSTAWYGTVLVELECDGAFINVHGFIEFAESKIVVEIVRPVFVRQIAVDKVGVFYEIHASSNLGSSQRRVELIRSNKCRPANQAVVAVVPTVGRSQNHIRSN